MEQNIIDLLGTKETIFFALFMFLFYAQQKEKREQNNFIRKQQSILSNLTNSFEKLARNQEKLTERIERIEFNLEDIIKRKKGA